MKPILFESTATGWNSKGLGTLTDAISCKVTEERNGAFTLEMQYPMSGIHYAELTPRRLILAKPNNDDLIQPFRIYRITKPINGKVTVYAEHISYDLNGIPDNPFTASNAAQAVAALKSNAAVSCPFTFTTDVTVQSEMALLAPASIRSLLFNKEGSIVDHYGGEWEFNGFSAYLHANRGSDNGVTVRYGKNLTTLEQDENIAEVYTGVLPFYYSESDGELHGRIQNAPGTFDFVRILPLDLTDKFESIPTAAALEAEAIAYIQRNDIGIPKVSLSFSFVELSKAAGYENIAMLERVNLCDTVTVIFDKLNVRQTAKVVKTEYDVLKERYISLSIGTPKTSVADTIAEQAAKLEASPTKGFMQKAITFATEMITGNRGGYVVMHDSTGSGAPDEILIMDTPDIETAVQVWRWNKNGLGYSNSGYAGPYGTAITIDGTILGNYLKVNTVEADKIVDHSLDDRQIKDSGITVKGGSGGGQSGGGILAPYTIGSGNIGGGAVGSFACDGYINGGVAEGYYAASIWAGSVTANNMRAINLAATNFAFKGMGVGIRGTPYGNVLGVG